MVPFRIKPRWIVAAGSIAIIVLAILYLRLPDALNPLLIGWAAIGAAIYGYEHVVQDRRAARELVENLSDVFPPVEDGNPADDAV